MSLQEEIELFEEKTASKNTKGMIKAVCMSKCGGKEGFEESQRARRDACTHLLR